MECISQSHDFLWIDYLLIWTIYSTKNIISWICTLCEYLEYCFISKSWLLCWKILAFFTVKYLLCGKMSPQAVPWTRAQILRFQTKLSDHRRSVDAVVRGFFRSRSPCPAPLADVTLACSAARPSMCRAAIRLGHHAAPCTTPVHIDVSNYNFLILSFKSEWGVCQDFAYDNV